MGTISMQVVTSADGTLTKTRTVSESDATRLVAAYQNDANVSVNGTATRTQVWNYIVEQVYAEWIAKVKLYETQVATTTATSSVTPISLS